jgi:hypothetical protein
MRNCRTCENHRVGFDLAVWEGDPPGIGRVHRPVAAHRRLRRGLLARWPDIESDAGLDSPWSDGPLLGNASGRLFYFGMTYSSNRDLLREAIDYAVALAAERGLVCYDPQYSSLR